MFTARVHITLKRGVLDPQGRAIETALSHLGFTGVRNVRQGKFIELVIAEYSPERAREQVEAMCARLLANPVIETWRIEIEPAQEDAGA